MSAYDRWKLASPDAGRWQAGENIQHVFPDMPADVREMMISGTHPACWEEHMKVEEANEV